MAPPFEAVMAFASGAALLPLAVLFLPMRRAHPAEFFLGVFASLWGAQAMLANLGRVLEDPGVHRVAFLASFALLPAAYLFLGHAALRDAGGTPARALRGVLGALAVAASAVLVAWPSSVLAPGEGFTSSLGPAAMPLFLVPFFGAFYIALVFFARSYARARGDEARLRARTPLVALAFVTGYLATRQTAVYLAPPPGIPSVGAGQGVALVVLFAAGLVLVLALAARLALRPGPGGRDATLLAAFALPVLWAGAEVALAGPEGPVDSIGLWRLAAVAALLLHRHHLDLLQALAARERLHELARLRDLDALKTRFMNEAAHELRTPLTPIQLQLDVLRSRGEGLSEAQRQSVRVLDRNVQRLSRLVDDLLVASKLQAERLPLQRRPVDLAALAAEAVQSFGAPARAAGVDLALRAPRRLDVEADPVRLAQVLDNLLENALRHTPAGGRVEVLCRASGGRALVRVRDTGVGLAPEAIEQLFQPFSHAAEPPPGKPAGSGLGLFISRAIVEQHGGTLAASSDGPGRGATFDLALPLAKAVHGEPRVGSRWPDTHAAAAPRGPTG